MLQFVLSLRIERLVKTGLILLSGYGVFILSAQIQTITHAKLPYEILLEPLLICMVGSFIALARKLCSNGWQVKIAVLFDNFLKESDLADIKISRIGELNKEVFQQLGVEKVHTIVALLSDEDNYRICKVSNEHFSTKNIIVRLQDRANFDRFHEMFATVVETSSAFVSLLNQFVRAPFTTSLLMGMEENQEIKDIYVHNPDLHGLPLRDLALPLDTLVLSIKRNNHMLISHGYTQLETGDLVTVVGSPKSLKEVVFKFDG